ncbi:MAG TPA: hypothetical protein VII23_20830 [Terriglobales bacterium]
MACSISQISHIARSLFEQERPEAEQRRQDAEHACNIIGLVMNLLVVDGAMMRDGWTYRRTTNRKGRGFLARTDPLSIIVQRTFPTWHISELAGSHGATTDPDMKSVILQEKTFEQRSGFATDKPRDQQIYLLE